jgi:dihydrofolate reductase
MVHKIEAILAVNKNYGLAKNGQIPWKSKNDMIFFKNKTINNVVVMGTKTFLSLPKGEPLKDRLNIILTRDVNLTRKINKFVEQDNVLVLDEEAMLIFLREPEKYVQLSEYKYLKSDYTIFIIGGLQIYERLCRYCSTIWLTKIKADYECDLIFKNEILDSYLGNVEYVDDELEIIKLTI